VSAKTIRPPISAPITVPIKGNSPTPEIVFQKKRGWNSGVGELPLIGTVIGALIGGLIVLDPSVCQNDQTADQRTDNGADQRQLAYTRVPPALLLEH
jgi:hypothetical protein